MAWLQILADVVYRAAWLVALAIAPPFLDPEPGPPSNLLLRAGVCLVLLAAAAYGARRLRAARGGTAPSTLILAALALSVACAAIFRGDRAPLGRGILLVALPLWAGLALAARVAAGRRLGDRGGLAAAIVVAGVGLVFLGGSARWIVSPDRMWARCLDGGDDPFAIDAMTRDALRAHDNPRAILALDRCLEENPHTCACLAKRAEVRMEVPGADPAALDQAIADARAAVARCPGDRGVRVTLALAIALRGDGAEAEKEARAALKDDDRNGRLHFALALALDKQARRLEALGEAQRAADLGDVRDAAPLFNAIATALGDLDVKHALDPVTGAKGDAPALYDRARVAERLRDDDAAHADYIAALHVDPTFASARYGLVVLALRRGSMKEAQHHAAAFAKAFPDDPRNADITRRIAAATSSH